MTFLPGWFPGVAIRFPTRVYQGSTHNNTSGTTRTFTSHAIGVAHASRLVVVAIQYSHGIVLNRPISSVTIGGNTATLHLQNVTPTNTSWRTGVASLAVASGTTATITVTVSGVDLVGDMVISVYALYNLNSHTPVHTAGNAAVTTTSISVNLNISAGGIGIAAMISSANEGHTIVGLVEDADALAGGIRYIPSSSQYMSAETGRTISQSSASSASRSMSTVSWR